MVFGKEKKLILVSRQGLINQLNSNLHYECTIILQL